MTQLSDHATVPTVVRRGEGTVPSLRHPALPQLEVKLDGRAGAGLSVLEYVVPPRFAPPPVLHRHTRESATGYIVDGEITYWFADGSEQVLTAGSVVHLPAGAWFRWANRTDRPITMLFVFQPAGFEQFFVQLMDGIEAAGGDPAAIGEIIHPLRRAFGDEDYDTAG